MIVDTRDGIIGVVKAMDNFSASEIKDIRTGPKNHIVEFKNGYLYSIAKTRRRVCG
jgi:hypothetical protein